MVGEGIIPRSICAMVMPLEEHTVRKTLSIITITILLSVSATWTAARQARTPPAQVPSIDETLKNMRADLQAQRSDMIAKNVTLTSAQAAKFWPIFEKYQGEQNAIMDEQLKSLQQYVDNIDKMDDAGALALIKAHLDRDARMVALRLKWLPSFQEVLPTKLAVRVMQIDRRLSLAHQAQFASLIPLVH